MLSALFIVISGQAYGWESKTNSSGETLHWKSSEIHYSLNTDGSHGLATNALEEAITNSANAWNIGNTTFVYDGDTKKNSADYSDNVFAIYFSDNWTEDPDVMALTYTWSTSDGEIVHFDMEINAEHHDWSTEGAADKQDLQNAVTHEFGHALGLDHSADLEATMAATAVPGETSKRDLEQDDIDGYQSIYKDQPINEENTTNNTTQNSGSTGGFTQEAETKSGRSQALQNGTNSVPLQTSGCSAMNHSSPTWIGLLFGTLLAWRRRTHAKTSEPN